MVELYCADALQARGEAAFVFAVTAQVEQAVFPCQWGLVGFEAVVIGGGDPVRGLQLGNPCLWLGPREAGFDQAGGLAGVEAGVALGDGQ